MGSTYHILGSIYEKENNDIAAMKMYETAAYAYENISSYFALANIYEKRKQISFAELFRKTGKNLKKQKKAEK